MIDRKLSAAVLLALAVQTGGVLVWAGAAAQRIAVLEGQVAAHIPTTERLARLEARLDAVQAQLDRIEDKVDRP